MGGICRDESNRRIFLRIFARDVLNIRKIVVTLCKPIKSQIMNASKSLRAVLSALVFIFSLTYAHQASAYELTYSYDDATHTATVIGSAGAETITYVTIPETVYNNGIPYTVTAIGDQAFYQRYYMMELTIPETVTSIGVLAFCYCVGLSDLIIPESVTSIGNWAFNSCTGLTDMVIPGSVTSIGQGAFSYCTGLTNVTIPGAITSIGQQTFLSCTNLQTVTVEAVTPPTLDETAFSDVNTASCKLIVPKESIDAYKAADYWNAFGSVEAINTAPYELTYSYDDATMTATVTGNSGIDAKDNVVIPETVYYNDKPYTVTAIGMQAFNQCSDLTKVSIPKSVTSIDIMAFSYCSGLTEVVIPESVTSIGNWAFFHCTGLVNLSLPGSVTSIKTSAFDGCTGLQTITCEATTPPALNSSVFNGVNTGSCKLIVPKESIDAYKAANQWKDFTNIEAIGEVSGIESIEAEASSAEYYKLNGQRVYGTPCPGIYLRRQGNVTTKVLVK